MSSNDPDSLPLVSIIIPVYNGSDYLEEALRSALDQTYPNIEILVVDDGSDDGGATSTIAQSFGERVRYLSKPNEGVASALNLGVQQMAGELFSWLSHDDLYLPEKIQRSVELYLAKGSGIIFTDYFVTNKDSERLNTHHLPPKASEGMRCFLTESNALHGCTLLIPRKLLIDSGGFPQALKTTQDYALWFHLASHYPFHHLSEALVGVRFHSNQATSKMRSVVLIEQDRLFSEFILRLTHEEVTAYTDGNALNFYFTLYKRFRASRLRQASRNAFAKMSSGERGASYYRALFLLAMWQAMGGDLISGMRISLKRYLVKNDNNRLHRLIMEILLKSGCVGQPDKRAGREVHRP